MADSQSRLTGQRTLTLLVLLCVIAGTLVILPYLQYILFAVVIAYIFTPMQYRLEQWMRPVMAASITTTSAVLMVITPSLFIIARAVRQGLQVLEALERGDLNTRVIEQWFLEFGYEINLQVVLDSSQDPIAQAVERLAVGTFNVARGLPDVLIGLTITLFVLFTLLRDGRELQNWLLRTVPIRNDICGEFIEEIDRLMWASVVGNVAVAAIQGILMAFGLWVAGLSNIIFLGVATFVVGVLPLIGVFAIWVPLAAYLIAVGDPITAAFIIVFGAIISVSDFYLRPAVIGHSGALSAAIVVVGIFGGIVVVGAVGLFVGPVILGGSKAALDIYAEESDPTHRVAK